MKARVAALIAVVMLVGCGSKPEEKIDRLTSDLEQVVDEAKQLAAGLHQKAAQEAEGEVEKLFTFEYKVVEFEKDGPAADLESSLTKLGQDRWECSDAHEALNKLRFICMRRPKTYLRYLPRMFP